MTITEKKLREALNEHFHNVLVALGSHENRITVAVNRMAHTLAESSPSADDGPRWRQNLAASVQLILIKQVVETGGDVSYAQRLTLAAVAVAHADALLAALKAPA